MESSGEKAARWREIAEEVRESGIDGRTLARRIGWLLPQLPEEADGALWEDVRAVRQQNVSNADLVAMILRMADELERGDNP